MKIVLDTNIVFSALANSNSIIAAFIFNNSDKFDFYVCDFTNDEINNHHDKLKKASHLSDEALLSTRILISNV